MYLTLCVEVYELADGLSKLGSSTQEIPGLVIANRNATLISASNRQHVDFPLIRCSNNSRIQHQRTTQW